MTSGEPSPALAAASVLPLSRAPIVAGAAVETVSAEELAQSKRDLFWVLLGCVPLALTFFWFDRNSEQLSWLSRVGRSALGNAVSSLELLVCLNLVHRGRSDLRELWGDGRRFVVACLSAVALGVVVFLVWWLTFHLLEYGRVVSPLPQTDAKGSFGASDWIIFSLTTSIAAGATGLTIYGVVLRQLIHVIRSRWISVLMAASIATVVWNLSAIPSILGAELLRQILLATAVVFTGRVWPVSLASAASTILIWMRFDHP